MMTNDCFTLLLVGKRLHFLLIALMSHVREVIYRSFPDSFSVISV